MKTRIITLAVAGAILLAACGTSPSSRASDRRPVARERTGCTPRQGRPGPIQQLRFEGRDRRYLLALPDEDGSRRGEPAAGLILNFHGFGFDAERHERVSRLGERASAAGFVVVTPDGLGDPLRWDVPGSGIGGYPGAVAQADPIAFATALVRDVADKTCLKTGRFFAVGYSNGAELALDLACHWRRRVAGVAVVAGPNLRTCALREATPILAFHGTDDPLAPYTGGRAGGGDVLVPSSEAAIADWADQDGCAASPTTARISEHVSRTSYERCDRGVAVALNTIRDGGHTWPGAPDDPDYGPATQEIDATTLLVEFFEHTRAEVERAATGARRHGGRDDVGDQRPTSSSASFPAG